MNRVTILPKTKLGRLSSGITFCSFIGIFLQYWVSIVFGASFSLSGFLMAAGVLLGGVLSGIAILKNHDYAVGLFISALIGVLGVLFVLGEFLFPH